MEGDICFICLEEFDSSSKPIPIPCGAKCSSKVISIHAKCLVNWLYSQKGNASCPLCRGDISFRNYPWPKAIPRQPNLLTERASREAFVSRPLPKDAGVLRCYVRVMKNAKNKRLNSYDLYMQSPTLPQYITQYPSIEETDDDTFLMCAANTSLIGGSSIGMSLGWHSIKSKEYIAKLQGSFLGLEYELHSCSEELSVNKRKQLITKIAFSQNRTKNQPKKIHVDIASPKKSESAYSEYENQLKKMEDLWDTQQIHATQKISSRKVVMGNDLNISSTFQTESTEPRELENGAGYTLNFGPRVTHTSAKNFQLIHKDEPDNILLQFGRTADEPDAALYTMDVKWPFSLTQAFGICIANCDFKLGSV